MRNDRRRVSLCLLFTLWIAGCGGVNAPARSRLVELVVPSLEQVEPAVRTDLERALADVRGLAARPDTSDETLGAAYGELGRLYHAYQIYDSALPCYLNARTLLPDDYRWSYYLGRVHAALEEPEKARADFERVLDLEPHDSPALVALAEVHRDQGNLEEAARLAEQVLARDENSAAALLLMAELAADRGDDAEAVERYETLLGVQPGATSIYPPLAMAYRNLGRLDDAERYLEARGDEPVTEFDPLMDQLAGLRSGSKAEMNRGTAAFQAGQFELAEQAFRNAVEITPDDTGARLNLGSTLVRLGKLDEAVEQYRTVLALDPDHARTHFNLGVVLGRMGEPDESKRHYEQAIRIDPDYANPRFNLANTLRREGRCADALRHYRRLLEMNPGQGPVRAGEAACLMQDGRFPEALEMLEQGLELLPQSRVLRLTTARLLAACPDDRTRDAARALGLAEQLVAQARSPLGLEALAMALAENGRYDEAVQVQQEAIEMAERADNRPLYERLGRNLERYERNAPCRDPVVD